MMHISTLLGNLLVLIRIYVVSKEDFYIDVLST